MSFEYQMTADDLREAMAVQSKQMIQEAQRRNLPIVVTFMVVVGLYVWFYMAIAPPPRAGSAPEDFFQMLEELRMLLLPLFAMALVGRLVQPRGTSWKWLRVAYIAAVSFLLLSGPALWRVWMGDDASDHQFAKLLRALNPGLLWCAALIYFASVVIQNQRRAFQQLWKGQPHLHGVKTVRFDDTGMTIDDPTLSVRYSWHAISRVVERPNVIVLFLGGIVYQPISKRGVSEDQLALFRALLKNHVETRVAAFPVIVAASDSGTSAGSAKSSN
jgi:hypothetical protein